jgi:hypothetical protein
MKPVPRYWIPVFWAAFLPMLLIEGLAIRMLWSWFVTPYTHLPAPSVVAAAGISLLVLLVQLKTMRDDDLSHEDLDLMALLHRGWLSRWLFGIALCFLLGGLLHLVQVFVR